MPTLYKIPLKNAAQTDEREDLQAILAEHGILDGDQTAVEGLSNNAERLVLEGQFRYGPHFSQLLADELEELADSALGALPVFGSGREFDTVGYYEIERASVQPAHGTSPAVMLWELTLMKMGSRQSHYRSVETNPTQIDHEWGNDTDALVATPATARKVRWFDAETRAVAPASETETRTGAYGDLAVYDLADGQVALGVDAPTLIYEVPYDQEARFDVHFYDTLGQDEKYLEGADGKRVRAWETIFVTDHDIDGAVVLENGLLRLWFDEGSGSLEAEEWDASSEEWAEIGLPSTDWAVYDVDVTSIGMAQTQMQVTFEDDGGELVALNVRLERGHERALWWLPADETGPIPEGLEDLLEPVAAETQLTATPTAALVERGEVRR